MIDAQKKEPMVIVEVWIAQKLNIQQLLSVFAKVQEKYDKYWKETFQKDDP